ncbi:hypothetical protein [Kibdelosporangium aridum]|uniref:hypothetical protein n=1 Tax=Kibdelosporangium aridum TaxID=2030 RepID=UPI000B265EED
MRTSVGGLILAIMAVLGSAGQAFAGEPRPEEEPFSALVKRVDCDKNGPTQRDGTIAAQLNPKLTKAMRGYMDAYRVSCAREVVEAVQARKFNKKAAVIAITTVIVETRIVNVAEKVDHTSLGLFQQQDPWGSEANRLNPTWATNAFLDAMVRKVPDWNQATTDAQIGAVCQKVQVSAYPERYPVQVSDAKIIVDALWTTTPPTGRDSGGYYNPADGTFHLRNALSDGASNAAWDTALETIPGAVVLTGDWNGDRKDSTGYYDPRDGTFHIRNDHSDGASNAAWDTGLETIPGAVILTGDWNGDGKDSTGYYDPRDGTFHLSNDHSTGPSDYAWDTALETVPDAVILAGDWNGDGKDSVGYYNKRDGSFHLRNALSDGASDYAWDTALETIPNAVVLTGDWNADKKDSTGYYNPNDGSFHLRDALSDGASDHAWDTALETIPNAVVLTGDWDGA